MSKIVNVGMIGTGFMGKMHTSAYTRANDFFESDHKYCLKAVCSRNESEVNEFAKRWSWQEAETDWRRLLDREDIDLIDICVPNNLHCEIAVAALSAGKMAASEKPLAMSVEEGRKMVEAESSSGKKTMIWFNQRRFPAVTLAKQVIDSGALGRIFHYRAAYLQDWTISTGTPLGGNTFWRLDAAAAGSGVTGDLVAHSLDIAMWLNGPITELSAITETFIKERQRQDKPDTTVKVEIDDASQCMTRFANGSIGSFEATRYACGRKNAQKFEINGELGSLAFNAETPHELQFYNYKDESSTRGWRTISVWDSEQPYMEHWWIPGVGSTYEHTFVHAAADLLADLDDGKKRVPDFSDGLSTQMVCDTIISSAKNKQWIKTGL